MNKVEVNEVKKCGERISFIGNHIWDMVCCKDPISADNSASTTHRFLGLLTERSRHLCVIVFCWLVLIIALGEEVMFLLAYLQCFFCECNCQDSLE